jgi:hypothetical protein
MTLARFVGTAATVKPGRSPLPPHLRDLEKTPKQKSDKRLCSCQNDEHADCACKHYISIVVPHLSRHEQAKRLAQIVRARATGKFRI